jgi:hypothetical protein
MDQIHDRSGADNYIRIRKSKIRDMTLERFARYGHNICQLILDAVMRRRGLFPILQKLGLQPPVGIEEQLDCITRYLSENGAHSFLKKVDLKKTTCQALLETPVPEESLSEASAAKPMAPLIANTGGEYAGPERRLGNERRSGKDRRQQTEAINKNKRFGGDRRRSIRRACDRQKALRGDWPPGYPARIRAIMILS